MRRPLDRAVRWWCLHGQFSLPVRALSPHRRAVRAEVRRWTAAPGSAHALLRAVADRVPARPPA
ncbi:hypothetical protein P3T27_002671 [Kitasatospora sp. MAA19]|uniref:hypothetical protein n=1 Tax=unclassified Kitasatospora TaxID=2633591 RepID=UPI00247306B6|nr:hypothetical protein [Kitasatospora sp. MAA19]MDH6705949.1 hypothetical protein [Kitasatospora sp. MAA19]